MQLIAALTNRLLAVAKRITATDTSTAVDLSNFTGMAKVTLNSSATEGATMTSDVKLVHCDTIGGTYTDTGIAFTQVTNAAASFQILMRNIDGLKQFVKVVNTLGGTSPAVTYSVQIVGKEAG